MMVLHNNIDLISNGYDEENYQLQLPAEDHKGGIDPQKFLDK